MGINAGRRAGKHELSSGWFSHFGDAALERNHSTKFTPPSKAVLVVEGIDLKNWTACLEPRGLRPKAAEKRLVLQGRGTHGQAKYKSHLAVRPVEVPRTLRDYSSGSPEFEG